jgi:hypothetical protein
LTDPAQTSTSSLELDAIDGSFVAEFRSGLAFISVTDETIIFDELSGAIHQLDPVATIVCSHFDGNITLYEVSHALSIMFDADPHVVAQDVIVLAKRLGGSGLLNGVRPLGSTHTDGTNDDC